jgi:membrane protease YdiL (CAAX protease family)
MITQKEGKQHDRMICLLVLVISWFAITHFTPLLNKLFDFRSVNPWILPYIRMALLLFVTWGYVSILEKKTFSEGFNIHFRDIGRNFLWALVFFALAFIAEKIYSALVMKPLIPEMFTASSSGGEALAKSLGARIFEYFYIVFEGAVEVLVFIGVLIDRVAKKWGWTLSIVAGNIIFALWHYAYWRMGWLPGTLLIVLTFIVGSIISINYMKTKNTLSSIISHIFVDSPSAIKILMGK